MVRAQGDDRYATPDGEDYYGPRYQATQVPAELKENLDDQGDYIVPWFIDLTIKHDEQECWVIDQLPAPGSVVHGPQTYVVRLKYTCGNDEEYWARLPVELVDITPPEVNVLLDSNVNPQISFGGVTRYVVPNAVVPVVSVSDSCDQSPTKELLLNGQPYEPGTPISEDGLHILHSRVVDASANESDSTTIFEIRQRPSLTGAAVVQNTSWEVDQGGQLALFRATVVMSADDFDHEEVMLSSVRMLLRAANGQPLQTKPIPILGAFREDCNIYQPHNLMANINRCRVAFTFEAEIQGEAAVQPPAELILVGAGMHEGALSFEWGARAANVADPNAEQTLLSIVSKEMPCGNPTPPPPPPPPPPCQQIETVIDHPFVCPSNPPFGWIVGMAPCAAGSGTVSSARADGNGVGNSLSVAFAPMSGTCGAATTAAAIAAGTASGCGAPGQRVLIEQMVGDCCNCAFSISATGTVQVFASAGGYATLWGSFTAYAEAAGQVVFWSPCDSTASPGALASASASEAGSSMPNPDAKSVTMPVLACTDHACTSMVIVSTTVIVQTHATATHTYSSAVAEAGVNASSNHTVTGSAAPCLPDCD